MFDETVAELEPLAEVVDRPQRVLIIDDDEAQRESLAMRLNKIGFETDLAGSGRAGLDLANETRPDLVLLDLRLPDLSGFDVCAQLADEPETCCIPVIILSGMERPDIVRRSRAAGCEYYVRKPYDPNVLLALIRNALAHDDEGGW